jgi:hypothetical protein
MGGGRGPGLFNGTKGSALPALPNAESAIIPTEKLVNYALDPGHARGGHKATVFRQVLGYDQSNAAELSHQIRARLPHHEAVWRGADQYGQRFCVDMPITGPSGRTAIVRTNWIIRDGDDRPRLVSTYIRKAGK